MRQEGHLQLDYETAPKIGAESSLGVGLPGGIQMPKDDSQRHNCNCRKHRIAQISGHSGGGACSCQFQKKESTCL